MHVMRTVRACARGPRVAVLAVEGRMRARIAAPHARAACAGWIAANALAACGRWVRRDEGLDEALLGEPVVWVPSADPAQLLAALAVARAVPVGPSLSRRARLVLRLLGIPVIDGAAAAPGLRVLVGDLAYAPGRALPLTINGDATGYNVGLAPGAPKRLRAAWG